MSRYALILTVSLFCSACAQHRLSPQDICSIENIYKSAEWWVCLDNEHLLDYQYSLSDQIREIHANRAKTKEQIINPLQ